MAGLVVFRQSVIHGCILLRRQVVFVSQPKYVSDICNHLDKAESLFKHACRKGYNMPNEFWYWIGRRWWFTSKNTSLSRTGIEFYLCVRKRVLQSINMLCLCLTRLKIYKDLRQFIVKLIWHPRKIISWLK